MTATEIKAELYDLQFHVCTKLTHMNEKGEPLCVHCRRVEGLQKRLQELEEEKLRNSYWRTIPFWWWWVKC